MKWRVEDLNPACRKHNAKVLAEAGVEGVKQEQIIRSTKRLQLTKKPIYDRMNKTETEYSEKLEVLKKAGEILTWEFQPLKLFLSPKSWYMPDRAYIQNGSVHR